MPTGVSWVETLASLQADGPALTTNNVSTSIINAQAKAIIKSNSLFIGKKFKISFTGRVTTVASASTAHSISVLLGATVIFTSPFSNAATNATNLGFEGEITLTCRAIGTSANFIGGGHITAFNQASGALTVGGTLPITPVVGSNFDSTVIQSVDFQMLSTASITSIQLTQYSFESMN